MQCFSLPICSLLLAVPVPQSAPAPSAPGGGQLAWGDFDADGRPDLLALDARGPARLLRNRGDGGFDDVTVQTGLESGFVPRIALWKDVDHDGSLDLLLAGSDGLRLLRGDGAAFRDATAQAGLDGVGDVRSLAWIDFNGDGHDDLEVATRAGALLFHDLGQGVFEPVDLGLPAGEPATVVVVTEPREEPPGEAIAGSDDRASGADAGGRVAASRGSARAAVTKSGASVSPASGPASAAQAAGICAATIADATLGGCIPASAVPALGSLMPLSVDLNVDLAGNVGVGTTAPEGPLHVMEGSAGAVTANTNSIAVFERSSGGFLSILGPDGASKGLLFGNPTSNASGGIVYDQASVGDESMQFRTGGNATRMTITQAGDVGIGTTAPKHDLHVRGDSALGSLAVTPGVSDSQAELRLAENTSASLGMTLRYNGTNNDFELRGFTTGGESDVHFFADRDSGRAGFPSTAAQVGIGTAQPTARLHVVDAAGGDASVKLPTGSVSSIETLDEIGVASRDPGAGAATSIASNSIARIASSTVAAPTSGFILAVADVDVFNPNFLGETLMGIYIKEKTSSSFTQGRFTTTTSFESLSTHAIFAVSAGTQTFELWGEAFSSPGVIEGRKLTLLFIPTAYGSVDLD